jgi:molybdopterin-containing oxidoreductase family iron-sulfur binding subunit
MPDGFVQTACQQACPTDAIVFGDILDDKSQSSTLDGKPLKGSRARQLRSSNRSYMLLGLLNTRPRTTHMVRVNNPSPLLRKPVKDPFGPHGHHHHHDHDHDHGHEHDHDHGHEDKKKGAFVDPARRGRDGYVLSLAVLGGR